MGIGESLRINLVQRYCQRHVVYGRFSGHPLTDPEQSFGVS
jgi:hypothetical protein